MMPQNHWAVPFIRSADVFLVPIHNQLLSVGIEGWHEHDDDVMQDGTDARRVTSRKLIRKLGRTLGACDFR